MKRRGLSVGTCFILILIWPLIKAFQFWYAQKPRQSIGVGENKIHRVIPSQAIVSAMRASRRHHDERA